MFKIQDGREAFYQWDLDRKLIVEDASINQVHFCNKTESESLVVEVKDGVADVPNILLQDVWRICVYGYDTNHTKHMERFEVIARSKPQSYVYTETEVLRYETLSARIDKMDEDIAGVVSDYLKENPPEIDVDLSDYATKKDVEDAVGAIEVPDVDLSDYYTKTQTDKAISDAVGAIDIPQTDLSGYYTKGETDAAINAAKPNLAPYALKTEIPTVPDVSGFALKTEIPSIEGLATEAYVDEAIEAIVIPEGGGEVVNEVFIGTTEPTDKNVVLWINPDATGADFALKSEIPDVSAYQTAEQVNTLIETALGVIENGTY